MEHQIPKGTFDILPYGTEELWRLSDLWQTVEEAIRRIATDYNYREIRTPMFESTALFDRGVGETSDIVTKEMFTFQDRGGRSMTLRPEGTSSVMRAFIEHRLFNLGPVHKFFYIGPMFRYERPQSGRYRQHHQFGVEAIGSPHPEQDAEVIELLCQFYTRLGIKNLVVHINTVGDVESRLHFKAALLDYLKPHLPELSTDSQTRFEKNPLRILDSKDPKDREIVKNAPSILNYLTSAARTHFESVCSSLQALNIAFAIDDKIVRGLDYYNKTVFEVITTDLGAQGTIGAGGRFDGLLKTFGGPDLPAVGFATGLERVLQVLIARQISLTKSPRPLVYFIPMGEEAQKECFVLATLCRHAGIATDIRFETKKIQTAILDAVKTGAHYCVILGANELKDNTVLLKNLQTRDQQVIQKDHLLTKLKELTHV